MRIKLPSGEQCNFLPLLSVSYFCLSLVVIAASLMAIEFLVLPFCEVQGLLVTHRWHVYDARLKKAMTDRTYCPRFGTADEVWRTDAFPVSEKKQKSKRILVIGDSFVWGDGAANVNQLWWRQLALELKRRGFNDVEVIAAGSCAANTEWEITDAIAAVKKYKPDMIVWGYVSNDADEGQIKQKFIPWDDPQLNPFYKYVNRYLPQLGYQLYFRRVLARNKKNSNPTTGYEYAEWEDHLIEPANLRRYDATVERLSDFCKENRLPTFVIALPYRPLKDRFHRLFEAVTPIFIKYGFKFINPIDECVSFCDEASRHSRFLSSIPGAVMSPGNVNHPGPWLTYCLSRIAADELEKNFPNVLGKRSAVRQPDQVTYNDWVPANIDLRSVAPNQVELTYPPADKLFEVPGREPYLQLNLSEPMPLDEVEISGVGLKSARLYVSADSSQKFLFDNDIFDLGQGRLPRLEFGAVATQAQPGMPLRWWLPQTAEWADSVDTLRIAAKFGAGSARRLKVSVQVARRI